MNQVVLVACIVEISTLRYSPSGLPVVDLTLKHESIIEEMGIPRKVNLTMRSMAMGNLAEKLIQIQVNSLWQFTGFLASAKNLKSTIFHIQSIHSVS